MSAAALRCYLGRWRITGPGDPPPPVLQVDLTSISYLNHGLRVAAMLPVVGYAINVKVRGEEISTALSGEVPDGEYTVAGHDDSSTVQISVTRRGPDGRFIASATHTHGRET